MSFNTGIRTVAVYGGETKKYQTIELSKGCDIMVATPGRLIDLLEKGLINLKMIKYLIMDEADRMLDQNFYEDIKNIIGHTTKRKQRQNLLFSATFNDDIKGLAKYFLNNYYYFLPVLESPKQIKHEFIRVQNDNDKTNALISFLKKPETKDKSILIFLRTKNGVDELGNIMKEENIPYCTIHGDKIQADRIKSISEFSSGKKNVLIATDVASRGLDFPNVYCVVNFDLPQTNDDYIHRVGRTGRVGQEGRALTFIDGMDETNRIKLIHFLKNQGQEIPEWIDDSISKKRYRFFAANKRKTDEENNGEKNEDNDGFKKPFRKKNNDDNNAGSSWGNSDNK
ncbi:MAG: DEAD/DEAH box helicase, partial [Methanobrevibacter sp.]|nr:DEAD/DEAH box helicase [Methanobrevibacter sp.]